MHSPKIFLAYFSGTGSTKEVAKGIEASFNKRGYPITTLALDSRGLDSPTFQIDQYLDQVTLFIVMFPVYAFDAPRPIYDLISLLPGGNNLKTAVIAVSGGGEMWPNTVCRKRTIKGLEDKNYPVFYENMVVMPANVLNISNAHMNKRILDILPLRVDALVEDLITLKYQRWGRVFAASLLLALSDLEKKQASLFAKKYLAVSPACTACSWCEENCPALNITLVDGLPHFGSQCLFCMRCVYGCPKGAIYSPKYSFIIAKEGFDLQKMRQGPGLSPLMPIEKCCKGLAWIGVRKYLKP